jgi:hypothetical protein
LCNQFSELECGYFVQRNEIMAQLEVTIALSNLMNLLSLNDPDCHWRPAARGPTSQGANM